MFLLIGVFAIVDELFTALTVALPFVIVFVLTIAVVALCWSKVRSRFVAVIVSALILLAAYALGTPTGAVRAAVLFSGHPVEAATLRMRKAYKPEMELENWQESSSRTLYHVTKNAPKTADGDHEREMWAASRHFWMFYTARGYGETEAYLALKPYCELQRAQERKTISIYRAYESFEVHGIDVPEDTVVMLENLGEGCTRIVIYGEDAAGNPARAEDMLRDSELPEAGPHEIIGPWCMYLPLNTPALHSPNNSGVYMTPQLYAVMDPKWSQTRHLSYYEIEAFVRQINAINRTK